MRAIAAAAVLPFAGCGRHIARDRFPGPLSDFERIRDLPFETLRIGPNGGRGVILLHELPGLTRDDLALARALGGRGFNVYTPVLFGKPEQENIADGYREACLSGTFECSKIATRSAILDKIEPLCTDVGRRTGHSVGVIGMCLTGILPLALLSTTVKAAVLCQPTLPFNVVLGRPAGDQVRDLGLGPDDLINARRSAAPFLAVHYLEDKRCPPERVDELRRTFTNRAATIDLEGDHHSSLAGDFNEPAFDDVVAYLTVVLDAGAGPRPMRVARLGPQRQPCLIGADGLWHAIDA
jgi:dienelactone hydrolase